MVVRRKIYVISILKAMLRITNERIVNAVALRNEKRESLINSFLFPLIIQVANTKNIKTKRNIPTKDNNW